MKSVNEQLKFMLEEIADIASEIEQVSCDLLLHAIRGAKAIFISAGGRSFLSLKAFAMRLMQIGLRVYVVGEIVTPAIRSGDLLIVASGSGETNGPLANARKAKSVGAQVAVITTRSNSSLAELADLTLVIPVQTEKLADGVVAPSIQPGGNTFEQLTLLLGDALAIQLMDDPGRETSVMNLHANLE